MSIGIFRMAAMVAVILPSWAAQTLPSIAQQSERRVIISQDSDYFGEDYDILKDVTLDQCSAGCSDDKQCKAFTYNVSAGWCFLKSGVGELRSVEGAVSGRVVTKVVGGPSERDIRSAELDFIGKPLADEAKAYAARLAQTRPAPETSDALINAGTQKLGSNDLRGALKDFRQAARIDADDFRAWSFMADVLARWKTNNWQENRTFRKNAVSAAINAYLTAVTDEDRAHALSVMGVTLAAKEEWKLAIKSYRASLALREVAGIRVAYDKVIGTHGFRLLEHRIDSDAASPQICLVLSDDLALDGLAPEDYVKVRPKRNLALEARKRSICIDGVQHGGRYAITLREGLTAADGEVTAKSVDLDIYVRDRKAAVRFPGTAYILPGHDGATLPVITVNTREIAADLYRVGDRALARAVGDGQFLKQLNQYGGEQIVEKSGEKVWSGTVDVKRVLNDEVVTAIPVKEMEADLKPGAYVLVARATSDVKPWQAKATQWFVVTDLGLSTFSGNDGFHVLARSLTKADPLSNLDLRLVAVNNEILGTAKTDETGFARFDPGLVRGTEGMAPALLVAESADGDYAFLDLTSAGLDLTDRGVDGRTAPGPVDVFLTTERGIYRPSETVYTTALVRDATAKAITDLPLTMIIHRPDGKESERRLIALQAAGGSLNQIALTGDAMRGSWRVGLYTDPKGSALTETTFLVEDFLPERLDFDLTAQGKVFEADKPLDVSVSARFLYGAPASGLEVYGRTTLSAVRNLDGYPGFVFGLADEEATPITDVIDSTRTDEDGSVALSVGLPASPSATQPLTATLVAQVLDTSGRPVERSLTLPVEGTGNRLALKPLFDGQASENSTVQFDAIAIDRDGGRISAQGLYWILSKVEVDYQWYQSDGRWNYEPIYRKRRVASGEVDVAADGPAKIDVDVAWGGYELMLEPADPETAPVSHRFEAGWYVEQKSLDSPEALKVALDKAEYRIGDVAQVQITPPFAGKAQIMIVDNRVIETRQIDISKEGTTISIPVTEKWGAGAYVTAIVYRPMDLGNRRMPARAVGLAWAGVDPQDRRLSVSIETEDVLRPRQTMSVQLTVANAKPGDKAFVTLAAVDAGILNLTGFETPQPDEYYFGQRQLGVGIKDFYNRLIDRMQGTTGRVRSGGDASIMRFEGPPPPDTLMAFHSGIETVNADGTVTVDVPVPDFNGTVRLMAMAWSASGVGHGVHEVVVRDPVVLTASLPRFLSPGDQSRILIDVADVEKVGGDAGLTVSSSGDAIAVSFAERTIPLGEGDRNSVLIPLDAVQPGTVDLTVSLSLENGTVLTKIVPVSVRDNEPPVARTTDLRLAAGQLLTLSPDLVAGLRAGTGDVTLSASGAGRLDLAGIVRSLDQYPYGCSEQLTSRAMPLLYLDEVVLAAGLSEGKSVRNRVQEAIISVIANQSSAGGFGLWSPGSRDLWLDAYITDFLSRAQDKGYKLPKAAFRLALSNLQNRLAYVSDFESGGEGVAYALYILARHGQAAIGDVRYYSGGRLKNFSTPLAKAQLGAALALYGDQMRADEVFKVAVADLKRQDKRSVWRGDYGSRLRDNAAIVTLASEVGIDAINPFALVEDLDATWRQSTSHSTQEEAWSLLAAHSLANDREELNLSLNGDRTVGPLYKRLDLSELSDGVTVQNNGTEPVDIVITARGAPIVPEPAGGNFASLVRNYFALDGTPVDLSAIAQGERFVAVVTLVFNDDQKGLLIVNDPLPAGFEIDNPNLLQSGDVKELSWLKLTTAPDHTEFRADRFIASIDRSKNNKGRVVLGYVVRAVSPGRFVHPAAIVEDMYRMDRRARTASGSVEIVGPLR